MNRLFRRLPLTLLILASCTFSPDGEIFENVPKPSLDGASIDLDNYPSNEISLTELTEFHYSINTGGKELIETWVLLDGQIIWITTSASTTFYIDPSTLSSGRHTMRIQFTAKPGSGSLAEQLGAEVVYVYTERKIIIDNDVPQSPGDAGAIKIVNVNNVNGTINVSWEKYSKINFEYYRLIREDFDENNQIVGGMSIQLGDMNTTSYSDYSYIGGKSLYYIQVFGAGKTYTSPAFTYEHFYKPEIKYTLNADETVTVSWNSMEPLYENFNSYRLEVWEYVNGYRQSINFDFESVEETSVTFTPSNFYFGAFKNLTLHINRTDANPHQSKAYHKRLSYGDYFPSFDPYNLTPYYDETTGTLYVLRNFQLTQVTTTGILLDSLTEYFQPIRVNGGKAVGTRNERNYLIDLKTFSQQELTQLPDGNCAAVAADKLIIFDGYSGARVMDYEGVTLHTIGFHDTEMSPDGKYVFADPISYQFNGAGYEFWQYWGWYYVRSISYLPGGTQAIIGYANEIQKIDLATATPVLQSTAYSGPCNYDPVTGKVGCLTGSSFVILDASTFEQEKSLPVNADAGKFFLYNGRVICSSGLQIKLEDIP